MPAITRCNDPFIFMFLLLTTLWRAIRAKFDNYAVKTNGGKPDLGLPFARGYSEKGGVTC